MKMPFIFKETRKLTTATTKHQEVTKLGDKRGNKNTVKGKGKHSNHLDNYLEKRKRIVCFDSLFS